MRSLVILYITEEQKSSISDLFNTKQWSFNNLGNHISKDVESEIISTLVLSKAEEIDDDATGSKAKVETLPNAIPKGNKPDSVISSSETSHNRKSLRNNQDITKDKCHNSRKHSNLRSENTLEPRTKSKRARNQNLLKTLKNDQDLKKIEYTPENEKRNEKDAGTKCSGLVTGNDKNNFEDIEVTPKNYSVSIKNKSAVLLNENNCSINVSDKSKNRKSQIVRKDPTKKDYKCEQCSYKTNVSSNLNRHVREIHSGERYKCSKCCKTFKGKYDAKMHEQFGHTSGFQCKQCDKKFSSVSGLRNHVKIIHKKHSLYECEHCNKKFFYRAHFQGHLYKHLNIKPFLCKMCQKPFRYKMACHLHEKICSIDKHYNNHNSNGSLKEATKSKYLCDLCGIEVSSKSSLKTHHYYTHASDTTTVCSLCGKSFKGQYSLQRHIRNIHEDTGVRYTCPDCKKQFSQQQIFKQHLKIHKKAYTCYCETCGKGFLSKFKMMEHSRTHSGEKPFSCPHCHTFKSATKTNLQKHMKIHEEGRLPRQQSKKKTSKEKSVEVASKGTEYVENHVNGSKSDSSTYHVKSLVEPVYVALQMSSGSYVGTSDFMGGEGQYTNLQKMSVDGNNVKYDAQSYNYVYSERESQGQSGDQGQVNFSMAHEQVNDGVNHSKFCEGNVERHGFDRVHSDGGKDDFKVKVDSRTDYESNANTDSYYGNNTREPSELSQGLNILTVAMNIVNPSQF